MENSIRVSSGLYDNVFDTLISPPVFFFKHNDKYVPFPVLYYQLIEKPYHIRVLCKCKCCETILCKYYVAYGGRHGLFKTNYGYKSPNMWNGTELFTLPLPDSVHGHKLYKKVYKVKEVHDLYDGRAFMLLDELGDYTSRKYYFGGR